jgi:tRNA 5-methylaminomethyl-2-thiouridine biosynthesis bifunctional protein
VALKPAHLQWSEDGILRSADFGDIYFQPKQGMAESHYVFLEKNHLAERFAASGPEGMKIAELGFGTGLNFLLTAQQWHKTNSSGELLYVSIEKHPVQPADLRRIFAFWPELQPYAAPLLEQYPPPLEGFYHLHFPHINVRLMLCLGDVADVLPQLTGSFDAWYLDGFAPAKNPAMWDEKLFPLIATKTKSGGTLATFSSAGSVRRGLETAGFIVEKIKGFGVKRDMTVAHMPQRDVAPARTKRITILGAGLAGASAAYACARRGYEVTVIDRQPAAAQETSGNPLGILYPKLTADRSPLGIFFQHGFFYTRHLVTALTLPSWKPCGILELDIAEDAERNRTLAGSSHWPQEFMHYEQGKGLQFPLAGYLSPPDLCRRLLDHPGITAVYSKETPSLEELEGDAIIVALGYNTKKFSETSWLPSVSVRGQMTYLKQTSQSKNLAQVICHDGSISPALNGIHYAGATFQREEPATPALREEDHAENLHKLNHHVPELGFSAADIAGGRAGYRTSMPDHLPVIGLCPDYPLFTQTFPSHHPGRGKKVEGKFHERIYLSTGFGGQGLAGAPLAGEIIASHIAGDPLPVPESLMPYIAPERFILRDLKRGKI